MNKFVLLFSVCCMSFFMLYCGSEQQVNDIDKAFIEISFNDLSENNIVVSNDKMSLSLDDLKKLKIVKEIKIDSSFNNLQIEASGISHIFEVTKGKINKTYNLPSSGNFEMEALKQPDIKTLVKVLYAITGDGMFILSLAESVDSE